MWRWLRFGPWFLVAGSALGCQCPAPPSVCERVADSEVVFIGTVVSVAPHFLDYWNPEQKQSLTLLNAETARAQADRSGGSLADAKRAYEAIFPDLPEDSKQALEAANSHQDLVKAFYRIVGNGRRVRFKVKAAYRGDEDEDQTLDVWTPFGDCGVDFQTGETYLVYADSDEESNVISTDSCSGSKRVTDAGADLAYLYFYDNEDDAGRLDGFVTTNQFHQLDATHSKGAAAGVVVELRTAAGASRYAETGADGRFTFDGLDEGEYTLTGFAAGYPAKVDVVAGPQKLKVAEKGCASATLLVVGIGNKKNP